MRRLLPTALVVAALAAPAWAAAEIDAAGLVLRKADLPSGFQVARDHTGTRPNSVEAKEYPEIRAKLERWGRLTGYEAEFDRGAATISSRADVFRSSEGARALLSFFDREVRKGGVLRLERAATDIGDQGWTYSAGAPLRLTLVVWRHGRVFAGVMGEGVARERILALARSQQRRVVTALR